MMMPSLYVYTYLSSACACLGYCVRVYVYMIYEHTQCCSGTRAHMICVLYVRVFSSLTTLCTSHSAQLPPPVSFSLCALHHHCHHQCHHATTTPPPPPAPSQHPDTLCHFAHTPPHTLTDGTKLNQHAAPLNTAPAAAAAAASAPVSPFTRLHQPTSTTTRHHIAHTTAPPHTQSTLKSV